MDELELLQNTLERFVKTEIIPAEHEVVTWDYFQSIYGKLVELGFTEVINQEELDRFSALKRMALILTKSGNLSLAMAILWQLGVNLFVLDKLENTGEAKEDLAASIAQGSIYVNWPWVNKHGFEMLYPLTFGAPEEKYLLLAGDGEQGMRLYLNSELPDSGEYIDRFAWSGLKEVRLEAKEEKIKNSVYLGKLSQKGLEEVRALECFLSAAFAVELMGLSLEAGINYANEREQFGQKLWDFQVLKHYLADAYSKYQVVKVAMDELAEYFSRTKKISSEADSLKRIALTFLQEVTDIALQVHGGNGYMREFSVQRFWRDGMLLKLYDV